MSPTVPDPLAALVPPLPAVEPSDERFHELKFVLDSERAARVEAWAAATFGAPTRRSCATTLLFLDTEGLDVARRSGDLRRERFRVRREEESGTVVLERKTKRRDRARVHAYPIRLGDVPHLAGPAVDADWPGRRFHRHVLELGLRPVCVATFERTAYGGAGRDGPVRITLDRALRGRLETRWSVDRVGAGADALEGRTLVETRFPETLPAALRALVAEMRLEPASFSKYRRVLALAGGLPGARP